MIRYKKMKVKVKMDELLIDPGEWRSLTPHQKHRVAILKPETTLAQVVEIVKAFGNPFGNEGKITARVELEGELRLVVHSMLYKR